MATIATNYKPPLELVGLAGALYATYWGLKKFTGVHLLVAAGGAAGAIYLLSKLSAFALAPPAGTPPIGDSTDSTTDDTGSSGGGN